MIGGAKGGVGMGEGGNLDSERMRNRRLLSMQALLGTVKRSF